MENLCLARSVKLKQAWFEKAGCTGY